MAFSTLGLKANKSNTNAYGQPVHAKVSPRAAKPSDRLNPKTVDPFNTKQMEKSAFGTVYSNGGIPCRLTHGSVRNRLTWDTPPNYVHFDPVLIALAEGLKETVHPFNFVSSAGFKELLEVQDARDKCLPIVPRLIQPIKNALVSDIDSVFENGLNALVQLSNVIGSYLNPHLKVYLSALCKRLTNRKYRDAVTDALNKFEQNGGREVIPLIKTKIPTYNSIV